MKSIDQMTDEEKVILLFGLLGERVEPWTESQQVAYLLGILQCPEGHVLSGESPSDRPKNRKGWLAYEVFPDIIFKQFIDSSGHMCIDQSGEETREFSEYRQWTVLTCSRNHEQHSSWFYVPPGILDDLKETLPSS